jgi:DNA-binding NarL/FixJ family response regulator
VLRTLSGRNPGGCECDERQAGGAQRPQETFFSAPGDELNEATAVANDVQEALTHRELEVLQHIAFGLSDKEVAFRLRVSPPTVHKFAGRVYAKLGARNRVEAVVIALRQGLLQL